MKLLLRLVALALVLGSACGANAFEVQYGSLFQVKEVKLKNGFPVLPLSRKKYANVRVLDKETFVFLSKCKDVCRQPARGGELKLSHVRAARTQPGMWIADVTVDDRWLITFLVFKKGGKMDVVPPEYIEVTDTDWLRRVQLLLQEKVPSVTEGK